MRLCRQSHGQRDRSPKVCRGFRQSRSHSRPFFTIHLLGLAQHIFAGALCQNYVHESQVRDSLASEGQGNTTTTKRWRPISSRFIRRLAVPRSRLAYRTACPQRNRGQRRRDVAVNGGQIAWAPKPFSTGIQRRFRQGRSREERQAAPAILNTRGRRRQSNACPVRKNAHSCIHG